MTRSRENRSSVVLNQVKEIISMTRSVKNYKDVVLN